jgi:hypothetical protein
MHTFKTGQYVTTSDGFTGFIYGHDGGRYEVAICEHDEERRCSASDLKPWVPKDGERVTEANNEHSPTGTIIEAGEETSIVVWPPLRRQVEWCSRHLEPAAWG